MRVQPFVLLVATVLAGCGSIYHPAGVDGGYAESQVGRNVFRVTVKGNIGSNQAETNEMALLRSAEVALQNGFTFFTSGGYAATGSAVSLATNVVSVPATTITIVCYGDRPETTAVVYDADRIVATLGPKYRK